MKLVLLFLSLSISLLPFSATALPFKCLDNQFTPEHHPAHIDRSLAQVFKTSGFQRDDYLGTAFVIDSNNQLLLTAAHVLERANPSNDIPLNETVNLRFPGINQGHDIATAKVLYIFDSPLHERDQDTSSGHYVEDVALLKLEDQHTSMSLAHLHLYMRKWDDDFQPNTVTVHSYYGASNDIVDVSGSITRQSDPRDVRYNLKCAMNVGVTIDGGDSGAPVLDQNGFAIAIVLEDFPKGAVKFGRVMPIYCLTEHLPQALDGVFPEAATSLAELIYDGSSSAVTDALLPSVGPPRGASNPLVFHAFTKLGQALESNEWKVNRQLIEKLDCPIITAAYERRIHLPRSIKNGLMNQLASRDASVKQVADSYLREGQALSDRGMYATAAAVTELSSAFYAAEVMKELSEVFSTIDALKTPKGDFGFAQLESAESLKTAQALKGYVDSIQFSRALHTQLGQKYDAVELPVFVRDAAVLAVLLSENHSTELQGQSWAALGKEALETDDYVSAFQAYHSAIAAGAKQKWVEDSYVYVWKFLETGDIFEHSLGLVNPSEIGKKQNAGAMYSPHYEAWIGNAEPYVERARKSIDLFSYIQSQGKW